MTLTLTTNDQAISQTGAVSVSGSTTLDAGTGDIVLSNAGNSLANTITATGDDITLTNTQDTTLTGTRAGGGLTLTADGALPDADIVLDDVQAVDAASISATGDISGDLVDFGDTFARAGNNLTLSNGEIGSATVTAGGNATLTGLTSSSPTVTAGGSIDVTDLTGLVTVLNTTNGPINVTNTEAGLNFVANAGGATGAVDLNNVTVLGGSTVTAGDSISGNMVTLGGATLDATGDLVLTDATLDDADLDAGGTAELTNVDADDVNLNSGGSATVAGLTSNDTTIEAGGALSVSGHDSCQR